ncbi:MAG: hypothetical protein J0H57_04915, partial [Rhodospirillales bacterium]|nr:hypothetical protein [Rhodospirillales bacterium]
GYAYDHEAEDAFSGQNYFPDGMPRAHFYRPRPPRTRDRLRPARTRDRSRPPLPARQRGRLRPYAQRKPHG